MRKIEDHDIVPYDEDIEEGIGFVCFSCKQFIPVDKEKHIQRDFIRHAKSCYRLDLPYTGAVYEDGEIKKL
jgi:hypothetical protein